jgi:hypothetical protein
MLAAFNQSCFSYDDFYFAPSALSKSRCISPGALPQAFTFRAFGAQRIGF